MNIENRYKYDPNIEKVEILEQIGANFLFSYQKLHRVLTVAARDVYQYIYYNINPDGSIILVLYDDEKDDMPEEPGCVRMQVPLGGLSMTPIKGEQNRCNITIYGEVNLGGYIPEFV